MWRRKPALTEDNEMAGTEGFEPSIELLTLYSLSRGAPSATRPRIRRGLINSNTSSVSRLKLP